MSRDPWPSLQAVAGIEAELAYSVGRNVSRSKVAVGGIDDDRQHTSDLWTRSATQQWLSED